MAILTARLLAALVLGAVLPQPPADTRPATLPNAPPTEYEVKAAFLYNFTRFVEWPPDALRDTNEPFVIAVLGHDPFGPILDGTVAGKTVAGHRIEVRRFARVDEIRDAQMVFIAASERASAPAILKALDRPGVLTVGDTEGFAGHGGTINFILQERRVRFEINPSSAEQAGLKMSSQLLKLATLVRAPKS